MAQVHWFPGHMAKALRLIEEQIKIVDFVIECRDARAPFSTRNPALSYYIGEKKRLVVLTKRDLADPIQTDKWVAELEAEGHVVLTLNVMKDAVKKQVVSKADIVLKEKRERDARRGIRPRTARALIVGVPNVGKSSIINKIALRNAAGVENRPGVTQALKLIKVTDTIELVDTPGVLWPKFETEEMGLHCALIGSVKETGYPLELVTNYGVQVLSDAKHEGLLSFYQLDSYDNIFEGIAKSRGFLLEAGAYDITQARLQFLSDLQNGRLGRITWDRL